MADKDLVLRTSERKAGPTFLNPIYNKTEEIEITNNVKVTPDALSEGKIGDHVGKLRTSDNDGDVVRESETNNPPPKEEKRESIEFISNKKRYQPILDEYKQSSVLYQIKSKKAHVASLQRETMAKDTICVSKLVKDRRSTVLAFIPIRNVAVILLKNRLMNMLSVYEMKHSSDIDSNETSHKIPPNLFSWSFKDFLKRIRKKNTSYLDDLINNIPAYELDTIKFLNDIEEMKRIIGMIFRCEELGKRTVEEFNKVIGPELASISSLIGIEDKLCRVIEAYVSADENDKCILEHLKTLTDSRRDEQKLGLEMKLIDIQLWNPIELRYTLGWIQAKRDQCEMKAKEPTDNLTKAIQNEIYEKELLQLTSRSTIDATRTYIEVLKTKDAEMNDKYRTDFDEIDNKNVYLQKRIDNLKQEMKHLTAEMARYRVEIEELRIKDEEEEQKRLEAEANKPPKKSKKKKGKDDKDAKDANKGKAAKKK